jgi:hypothetical protein
MNINLKYFLITCILFLLGQTGIWFQLNAQFMWEWSKRNTLIMSVIGVPFTYIFIMATGYGQKAFMGLMWPQRFLGFSIGIVMYAILTYFFLNQGMTWVSLTLAVMIIIIQNYGILYCKIDEKH